MELLDIYSLGSTYCYGLNTGNYFWRKSKKYLKDGNYPQHKKGKGIPNSQNKGWIKDNHP
jgi:hypothetical protein